MKSDIEKVKEIMISKEKFLENIWGVEFKLVKTAINSQFTKVERYSAYTYNELGEFYDRYKSRICDKLKLEIRYVEQVDVAFNHGYVARLEKRQGCFTYTAGMLLLPYFNGGQVSKRQRGI